MLCYELGELDNENLKNRKRKLLTKSMLSIIKMMQNRSKATDTKSYLIKKKQEGGRAEKREENFNLYPLLILLIFFISISSTAIVYLYNTCTNNYIQHLLNIAFACLCYRDKLCLCFIFKF